MAGKSAILTVKILSDASKASAGMDQATSKVDKFQRGLSTGAKVGAAALVGLGAAATKATLAAEEVASANARVGQTLENAGVGKATDRVLAYAESLESSLGVDEKVIKNTQAKLGTFHELASSADEAGGAFDRATLAAVDMAAAGFGDAETNAVQLGKALQDPVKGITALNKSGVTFTDAQKKMVASMVETGDMAGAQDLVLSELEAQVGGTAEATADSSAKMALAFADVGEEIGAALLPILDELTPKMADVAAWMKDNASTALLLGGVVAGLAVGVIALNAAFKAYQVTAAVVTGIQKLFTAAAIATRIQLIAMTVAQVASTAATKAMAIAQRVLNAAMRANPIGIVITAVMLLVAGIALLWKKNKGFRDFMKAAWKIIAQGAKAAWNLIKKVVQGVVSGITKYVKTYLAVVKAVWRAILTAGRSAWNGVKTVVRSVLDWVTRTIRSLKSVVSGVWSAIRSSAVTAFRGIQTVVSTVISAIRSTITGIKTVASGVWSAIRTGATTAFNAILRPINAVKSAFEAVKRAVESLIGWIGRIRMPSMPSWLSKVLPGGQSATLSVVPSAATAPTWAAPTLGRGVGAPLLSGGAGGGITINVTGTLNDTDSARAVRRVLQRDSRRRGGVVLDRRRFEGVS